MGRRLPDEVVYRIRLRIEANKDIAAIAAAVKVAKKDDLQDAIEP